MFTAIIAQKELIDKVNEYRLFLSPFLNKKDVVFCEWNPEGERLSEMLPALAETVGRRKEWRAVIVCDEARLETRNPFDMVSYKPEKYDGSIIGELDEDNYKEYEDHCKSEHEKKMAAYEEASRNPLTRLVTFFCDGPTVSSTDSALATDPGYERYIAEMLKKQALRAEIKGNEPLRVSMPSEIVCVAKRTLVDMGEDYETPWETHTETDYSRFYDWNMYFDKMRYLVFDILPKTQRNYQFDCIRFLYATMLLASNDIPSGSLSPNRVYSLECETDETAIRDLLHSYEAKLDITKEMLEARITDISSKRPDRLSDSEAGQIFCGNVNIPVVFDNDVDTDELYVSTRDFGLSDGCPSDEHGVWDTGYNKSKKTLHIMLKKIRRSLKRAATDCRADDGADLSRVGALNEFQIEDVKEHIGYQELAMLEVPVPEVHDESIYLGMLERQNIEVKKKIDKRMSKTATIAIGGIATFLFALSFFTIFYLNSDSGFFNFTTSLIFLAAAVGVFALVAFITLIFLRKGLVDTIDEYNDTAEVIEGKINSSLSNYSTYLGHVCNIRRGFKVLNAAETHEDPDKARIILYRKHIYDIEAAKAGAKEVFGHYMVESRKIDVSGIFEYDFNFDRPVEYVYEFPYTEGKVRLIDFIYTGNRIEVPVDFVKRITVRREEIYE